MLPYLSLTGHLIFRFSGAGWRQKAISGGGSPSDCPTALVTRLLSFGIATVVSTNIYTFINRLCRAFCCGALWTQNSTFELLNRGTDLPIHRAFCCGALWTQIVTALTFCGGVHFHFSSAQQQFTYIFAVDLLCATIGWLLSSLVHRAFCCGASITQVAWPQLTFCGGVFNGEVQLQPDTLQPGFATIALTRLTTIHRAFCCGAIISQVAEPQLTFCGGVQYGLWYWLWLISGVLYNSKLGTLCGCAGLVLTFWAHNWYYVPIWICHPTLVVTIIHRAFCCGALRTQVAVPQLTFCGGVTFMKEFSPLAIHGIQREGHFSLIYFRNSFSETATTLDLDNSCWLKLPLSSS